MDKWLLQWELKTIGATLEVVDKKWFKIDHTSIWKRSRDRWPRRSPFAQSRKKVIGVDDEGKEKKHDDEPSLFQVLFDDNDKEYNYVIHLNCSAYNAFKCKLIRGSLISQLMPFLALMPGGSTNICVTSQPTDQLSDWRTDWGTRLAHLKISC